MAGTTKKKTAQKKTALKKKPGLGKSLKSRKSKTLVRGGGFGFGRTFG